ncbi:MAG TPA: hypothetical protein VM939_06410 [Gemmatimonadaceae bacterium]|nr:hypothetical protein [Gemmatimonadaceae bacterium]
MSLNRSIMISCAAVILAGAAIAFVARAQKPAPGAVRVASAAVPAPKASQPAPASTAAAKTAGAPATAPATPAAAKPQPQVLINRETYNYPGAGRRDPFLSLMNTEELRPLLADLKLVAIAFDPTGRNSVAVLRDVSNKEQYRVKVGQEIGRMRVAAIREKNVVFGIEEFGYSRQESLAMTDSTKVRTQ